MSEWKEKKMKIRIFEFEKKGEEERLRLKERWSMEIADQQAFFIFFSFFYFPFDDIEKQDC